MSLLSHLAIFFLGCAVGYGWAIFEGWAEKKESDRQQ